MKHVLALLLCFALLLGLFAAALDRHEAMQRTRLERFFPPASGLRYQNGGFIPGFRPGKPTADFILKVITKITLFGALYLAIVAIMPILVGIIIGNSSLGIGGTSVIIVVGVALETVKALEAQMLMRHYKGFLE